MKENRIDEIIEECEELVRDQRETGWPVQVSEMNLQVEEVLQLARMAKARKQETKEKQRKLRFPITGTN